MEAIGPSRKLEKSMSVNRIGEYPKALKERDNPVASNDQRRIPNRTNSNFRKNDDRRKPNEGKDKDNNKFGRIKEKLNYKRDVRQNSISQEKLGELLKTTTEEKTVKSQEGIKNYLTERDEEQDANQKLRKSKKIRKNKGKRSKNLVSSIDEQKSPEFKRGPKLKLAKMGDKKRARVTRKTGGHPKPGSSPLKRKN